MHTNIRVKVANESADVYCWPFYCTVVTNILVADQLKLQYLVSQMYIRNEVSCIICLCSFFKILCFSVSFSIHINMISTIQFAINVNTYS